MSAYLPHLGSGLGYRRELADGIAASGTGVDWLEVITEHYLFAPPDTREALRELRRGHPLVPHGLELSLGSPQPPDPGYVEALAELVEEIGAPWFSDHLCFTRADAISVGTLAPLPRSRAVARDVARRAQRVQDEVGVPLILENITYHIDLPNPLTEAQFIAEVMEHCTCGLLLDLTNLDINSRNHHYDVGEFLDTIPVERVVQVHLAGGTQDPDGTARDTHSAPVPERVWGLLAELSARADIKATLLERDQDFPEDFAEITAEVGRARDTAGWGCGSALPGEPAAASGRGRAAR
ncbi:DUF692 family multinuclear iron-containing protein [Streptomyces sp. NPDC056519]|uniref:DUF692 domain-containing protein n=1 Tax=Streptomyces sp. NPDC056519 TaxID=3345849 RepID=UPI0036D11D54